MLSSSKLGASLVPLECQWGNFERGGEGACKAEPFTSLLPAPWHRGEPGSGTKGKEEEPSAQPKPCAKLRAGDAAWDPGRDAARDAAGMQQKCSQGCSQGCSSNAARDAVWCSLCAGFGDRGAPRSEAAVTKGLCLHTRYSRACSMNYEGLQEQQCLQQGLIPGAGLH